MAHDVVQLAGDPRPLRCDRVRLSLLALAAQRGRELLTGAHQPAGRIDADHERSEDDRVVGLVGHEHSERQCQRPAGRTGGGVRAEAPERQAHRQQLGLGLLPPVAGEALGQPGAQHHQGHEQRPPWSPEERGGHHQAHGDAQRQRYVLVGAEHLAEDDHHQHQDERVPGAGAAGGHLLNVDLPRTPCIHLAVEERPAARWMWRRARVPSVECMNTSSKLFRLSAAMLAAGGLCWVVKFVVIAATDGAVSGAADTTAGIFYISAVALMAAGLAGLGVALLAGRHVALRVLGGLGGLVAWVLSYMVIEGIAQAVVGDTDPVWLGEEIGIVATGAVLMTLGLMLTRSSGPRAVVE